MGENEWWGVGLGGGTCGPQKKKMLTFTFFFNLSGTLQGAYVMHVQGMTKYIWVKVCKTHTQ